MFGADRDLVAAGVGAGEADRRGGGVGAVLGELDHLAAGDAGEHALGEFDFEGGGADEVGAVFELAADGFDYRGVGVAERDGAEAAAVLDEFVTVDVPDAAALAAGDEAGGELGLLVVALCVGVGAPVEEGGGAGTYRFGPVQFHPLKPRESTD